MGLGQVAGSVVLSAWIASSAVGVAGCSRVEPPAPSIPAGAAAGLPEAPAIDRPVVDRTGLLSDADVERLSAHLLLLRERTGAQMAVLLVATTGEEPIEDYSMRVAEAWRGGSAERDDGLLLTMAMADRRMRLEVGYGLEQLVTDAEAQLVVDGMREDLRAGETARAIAGAIEAVARELPRTDPSLLDGGLLVRPAGVWTGAPITLLALTCVVVFVALRDPKTQKRRPVKQPRRAWVGLAGALAVISVVLAWLYADLSGPVVDEPIAFVGSSAFLLAVGGPLDRRARKLGSALARWATFATFMFLATFAAMAFSGLYLGSLDALPLLSVPFVLGLILLPVLLAGEGGGSSYSSSSYSSSSYSSSSDSYSSSSSSSYSSSSSSSYSGGGGGFGGGGASSSW